VYDVAHLQVFQADAVRGYGDDPNAPQPGRRLLPRPMHGTGVSRSPGAPNGAVTVAPDGSIAAIVPARRALTWQLTDPSGTGVVREREWVSFQAGEIRVCANCHGINTASQTGAPEPTNPPEALRILLEKWKTGVVDEGGCTSGVTISGARLQAKGNPTNVLLSGTIAVPATWTGVAPATNGVRITLGTVLDVTVSGGTSWKRNRRGTRIRYVDKKGTRGVVRSIDLTTRAGRPMGYAIRFVSGFAIPSTEPLTLALGLGGTGECAAATWNTSQCRTKKRALVCR
jgi:Hydrazine synthase alpha subunit middle domain